MHATLTLRGHSRFSKNKAPLDNQIFQKLDTFLEKVINTLIFFSKRLIFKPEIDCLFGLFLWKLRAITEKRKGIAIKMEGDRNFFQKFGRK